MNGNRKCWYVGLFLLASSGCLAIPLSHALLYSSNAFDVQAWRAGDVRQRARMVDELRRSSTLIGRTRQEVLELLGPPNSQSAAAMAYLYIHGNGLGDWLGLPFSSWSELLVVEFDPVSGRVSAVQTQD